MTSSDRPGGAIRAEADRLKRKYSATELRQLADLIHQRGPGRPEGPVYEYETHLIEMAQLCLSGLSMREAAKQVTQKQSCTVAASTLRNRFMQMRNFYLDEARSAKLVDIIVRTSVEVCSEIINLEDLLDSPELELDYLDPPTYYELHELTEDAAKAVTLVRKLTWGENRHNLCLQIEDMEGLAKLLERLQRLNVIGIKEEVRRHLAADGL